MNEYLIGWTYCDGPSGFLTSATLTVAEADRLGAFLAKQVDDCPTVIFDAFVSERSAPHRDLDSVMGEIFEALGLEATS
ncbi:hypothetical protein T8K17_11335 [Thalassobaculum sp. OXR-137]|uniref:hypothetical protein n=1 Tax=Thalassobaculum sp. OXR-137 TaxID=3100173 RepID=UPI002AC8C3A0|nr:hypothetical protein [Thalassobaculum sp. OXR-137]WPZ36727.1 hypothetical protein T8K17_11335 [Thalassobaculum sp. OXR-137]